MAKVDRQKQSVPFRKKPRFKDPFDFCEFNAIKLRSNDIGAGQACSESLPAVALTNTSASSDSNYQNSEFNLILLDQLSSTNLVVLSTPLMAKRRPAPSVTQAISVEWQVNNLHLIFVGKQHQIWMTKVWPTDRITLQWKAFILGRICLAIYQSLAVNTARLC